MKKMTKLIELSKTLNYSHQLKTTMPKPSGKRCQRVPNPMQLAMPKVILLEKVSSLHAVGRVSVSEQVLAVGRVMVGLWQN